MVATSFFFELGAGPVMPAVLFASGIIDDLFIKAKVFGWLKWCFWSSFLRKLSKYTRCEPVACLLTHASDYFVINVDLGAQSWGVFCLILLIKSWACVKKVLTSHKS